MRTALVTGGSSGMGLEYARQLGVQGYRLVLVSNRQDQLDTAEKELSALGDEIGRELKEGSGTGTDTAEKELNGMLGAAEKVLGALGDEIGRELKEGSGTGTDTAEAELNGMPGAAERVSARRVICRWADLTAEDAAEELHGWCVAEGLLPDVLVCNAGMFFFGELSPEKSDTVQAMLDLHIRANTRLCLLFGEEMKRRGSGRIIIVSSMAARLPVPGITIYSATKAYLLSFGKSLWFELKPYGVKVTTVCPAAIATPLYRLKQSLMDLGVKLGIIHTPKWLVHRALRASERGRRVIRPSLMNVYLPALIALLPARLEERIWQKLTR